MSTDTAPPATGRATHRPSSTTPADTAYWRRRLTELIAAYQVPGASLGILRDGAITEVTAGVLSTETGAAATPDSLWQIGSISKVWTATLVLQLVDEGHLQLDQRVVEVLPDFTLVDEAAAAEITVRQLLAHTSGMDGDVFTDTGRGDDCVARYLEQAGTIGQNHPVGATWSYCNSGYVVLGAIVEKVTGQTWDGALRSRIIEPLGLTHTTTLPEETMLRAAAIGHVGTPGEAPHPTPQLLLPRSMGPAGLISSRVHDLLCFTRAHLAGGVAPDGRRLLSEDAARQMTEHQATVPDPYSLGGDSWGLGWIRFDWDGQRLIGHDGTTLGQNAFLRVLPGADGDPDGGFAVALLTNGGRTRELYQQLFTELFEELREVRMPPAFTPPEDPPQLDLTPWLGTYERASVTTQISLEDGTPMITQTMRGVLAELEPDSAVQRWPMVAVSEGLYAATPPGLDTHVPVTFYQLDTGVRYVHYGVRANPMTTPASPETSGEDAA
ncbi:serine hydrolase domain-containing protein [Serinicoccus chungangensis]|uniref:serine hydrolase domain-containing protein n=1 Tax=Serinicoccus chungangensis TaxID=767452 RepID=UPI000ADF32DF|nr:serine hydrolase domain-containing protein [Serinicoccus chungangensis]